VRELSTPNLHEAPLLRLDSTRATAELNWRPRLTFEMAVDWTAEWYGANRIRANMRLLSLEQIARYETLL
jgi:CDP-glucose 4,6-dehydratase